MNWHIFPYLDRFCPASRLFASLSDEAFRSSLTPLSRIPASLLRIPCAEFSERLDKLLHLRKSNRPQSAYAFASAASYNAVVGGRNYYPDILLRVNSMCAEVHTDSAICTKLLVNGGMPWDQFSGNGHVFSLACVIREWVVVADLVLRILNRSRPALHRGTLCLWVIHRVVYSEAMLFSRDEGEHYLLFLYYEH